MSLCSGITYRMTRKFKCFSLLTLEMFKADGYQAILQKLQESTESKLLVILFLWIPDHLDFEGSVI